MRSDMASAVLRTTKGAVKAPWRLLRRITRPYELKRLRRGRGPVRLILGAGRQRRPGWLATDFFPRGWDIVYVDVTKRLPFPDGSVDRIFAEHVIEHISLEDGERFLMEASRVLAPGGKIRIATPDATQFAELLAGDIGEAAQRYVHEVNSLFVREREDLIDEPLVAANRIFSGHGHQFLYDKSLLGRQLERHGFRAVQRYPVGVSDDPELSGMEDHGRQIGEFCNSYETMAIEATRS